MAECVDHVVSQFYLMETILHCPAMDTASAAMAALEMESVLAISDFLEQDVMLAPSDGKVVLQHQTFLNYSAISVHLDFGDRCAPKCAHLA